jgi:hypothetical protein
MAVSHLAKVKEQFLVLLILLCSHTPANFFKTSQDVSNQASAGCGQDADAYLALEFLLSQKGPA